MKRKRKTLKAINTLIRGWFNFFQYPVNLRLTAAKVQKYGPLARGRILDIGAGDQPYRKHFPGATEYRATNTRRFYSSVEQDTLEDFTDHWIEDATDLPFPDGSFDAIVCFQVLSVIRQPAAFFGECSRVLAPGGMLLVTTDFLYPQWSAEDAMRHTGYHLGKMAEDAGLDPDILESYGGFSTMLHCVINRYMRDYPQRITKARGLPLKALRGAVLMSFLLLSPLFGLLGLLIYRLEREVTNAFEYTVNTFMVCRKGRQ